MGDDGGERGPVTERHHQFYSRLNCWGGGETGAHPKVQKRTKRGDKATEPSEMNPSASVLAGEIKKFRTE